MLFSLFLNIKCFASPLCMNIMQLKTLIPKFLNEMIINVLVINVLTKIVN
jgi:hypothetical protein